MSLATGTTLTVRTVVAVTSVYTLSATRAVSWILGLFGGSRSTRVRSPGPRNLRRVRFKKGWDEMLPPLMSELILGGSIEIAVVGTSRCPHS